METRRFSWFNMQLLVTLLVLILAAVAEAATISGTVTNTSGIAGRVYIGMKRVNGGSRVTNGVSVQTTGTSPAAFSIKGVQNDTYTLSAFVDRTGTGVMHANDPRVTLASQVVVNGNQNVGNLTLTAPGQVLPPAALAPPEVIPGPGGAALFVEAKSDQSGGVYADALNFSCNSGTIVRNNIPTPTMGRDGSLIYLSGLTDGATLSCTVTPVINGTAQATYTSAASVPVTIGSCTTAGNCNPSGVTVSGRVNLSGFTTLTGKTLLVILSNWNGPPGGVTAISNPATVQSYSIPGVLPDARAYRTEYVLIDTNPGIWGVGSDFLNERNEQARIVVDGGENVVAPDVTIKKRNVLASVHQQRGFDNSSSYWTNLNFNINQAEKHPVNVTLTNNTGTALPAEGASVDIFGDNYTVNAANTQPGDSYDVRFDYADATFDIVTVQVVKDPVEMRVKQSFPVGQVRIPNLNNPITAWNYSTFAPILPGSVTSAVGGNGLDDWQENFNLATNWFQHGLSASLTTNQSYYVNAEYEDLLGDRVQTWNSFTPMGSGPLITTLSPSTGGSGAAVTISGSGFTGATAVAFNGISTPFTVVNDAQITTTVPQGAARGPVTVTSGGITGVSTVPFEKTATVSGKLTNSGGAAVSGITVRTIGAGTPITATTNSTGDYILTVPAGIPLYVKFHDPAGTYRDEYTRFAPFNGAATGNDYLLLTTTDIAAWEAKDASFTAVKNNTTGMIRSRVTRNDVNRNNLAGVTFTVRSHNYPNGNPAYKLIYGDTANQPDTTLTSTTSSGRYFVTGIEQGDTVQITASMSGYGFTQNVYQVFNGSIGSGRLHGEPMPTVTLNPPGGTVFNGTPVTVTLNQPGTFYYTYDCCGNASDPRYFGTPVASGNQFILNTPSMNSIKYAVTNASGVFSTPTVVTYNVIQDTTPPTVTTNPGYINQNGTNFTYTNTLPLPLGVTFSANEPATIYYTTNGATPTTSSASVAISVANGISVPIAINQNLTTLKFFGVDSANNSSAIETVMYVLDNTPPTISNVNVNALNNSKTVSLFVTADDVSGIAGYLAEPANSKPLPTDPAWNGSQSLTITVAADGNFTYYVWVKDNAGNVSSTAFAASFTVDSTPPAAPVIDVPANGASLNTQTPTISGTAEAGSTINIYEGASFRASGIANGGAFVLTTNTMTEGAHFLTITAQDAAGNISPTANLSFIIDLTKPGIPTITAPLSGAYLNTATPTITGTAEANSTITIRDAATVVGTGTSAANGSFSIVTNPLLDGAYNLTVTATDAAGNEGLAASRSFTVDVTAPNTAILTNPANPTNQLTATFTFNGTDATSGVKSFECKLNTQAAFSACTSPVTYTGLIGSTPTSYTFEVRAIDNANNVDATPASYSWIVNTNGPNVGAAPAGGSFATFPLNVAITSDIAATVYYTLDGFDPTTASSALTLAAGVPQSVSIPAAGTTLKFFGRDSANNSSAIVANLYTQTQTITFGALAAKTYGDAPFTLGASASSGLTVAYSIVSGPATISAGNTLTITGAGPVTVRASQAGNGTYGAAAPVEQSFTVAQKALTITADAKSKVYGAADPALTYTSSALVGTDTISGALSRVAGENVGSYAIQQNSLSAGTNYTITYTGANMAITAKALTITADAKTKTYGAADPALTYTSSALIGTDTISGNLSRVAGEPVGTYAIQQGTLDAGANYAITYTGANLTITKANQTITFNALPVKNLIDGSFTLSATASSGLGVTYASSNTGIASVSGSTVTLHTTGSVTITAIQGGDNNWNAATAVDQPLTIITGQTITVLTPAPATAGYLSQFTVDAKSNSNLPVTYSSGSPTVCSNQSATFTILTSSGTCIVQYDQAGDATFQPAPQITSTTTAVKADQATVTVAAPTSATFGQTGLAATAGGGSGTGAYSYSAGTSTACSVNASSGAITISSGTGTCAVTATRATDANYNIASSTAATITINKATQTISFATLPAKTYGNAAFTLSATATSGLAVSYTSSDPTVATVSGTTVTILKAGSTVITAKQAGDSDYSAATDAPQTLTVNQATSTVTWNNPANIAYGTLLGTTQLNATASTAGTFSYAQPAGTKLLPGVRTLTVAFTPNDATNYTTATASVQVQVLNPTGDINGDGAFNLADALAMLRMSTGVTAAQLGLPSGYLDKGDVGPFNGNSVPDGVIDSGDAIVMLRKIVGLISWI